ncbi:MAG: RNA-binding transcriptional accessory protein [Deltaproteobacteria bacterium]|nr:RNA-binding transcriptional accessory protein [Deltaproteobacteria bacterium]
MSAVSLTPISFAAFREKFISGVSLKAAQAVLELAAEGGTVPFIARYRKEKTGGLDEVEIRAVIEGNETLGELNKRREFVMTEIHGQGNLTDELKARITTCMELGDLEEIYRPYKKKKKTKATLAREAGLEPLADWIWKIGHMEVTPEVTLEIKAKDFLNIPAGIATYDLALKGAQDIVVEKLSNDPVLRERIRANFFDHGKIVSKKAKGFKPHSKYEMYAEFAEPVKSLAEKKASHRYLAMRRGWAEEELTVGVEGDEAGNLQAFERSTYTPAADKAVATNAEIGKVIEFLKTCAKLAYTVHVHPSISNEVHRVLKDNADKDAITVFAENVRKVLLGSPFGPKCVLGIDPGLRTGCKVALIDKQGNFISNTVLQILGEGAHEKAKALFAEVTMQISIDAIAVGNGTGGREAETFIRKVLKEIGVETPVILVSESGASVYSASDVAREEFPELDLTVRGAISIARRLQDPLAELVKVDPKSIGVGQYQHDVSQTALKKSLGEVVESCVNGVGVDLNTASAPLLSYVAGIGPALAKSIVEQRKTSGLFADRDQLMKVPRFSAKVYEQCAGFLRIPTGKHPLDATGVHPERYAAVRDMAAELGVPVTGLLGDGAKKLLSLREKWSKIIGEFTFDDIARELEKPGRDPRDPFKVFAFRDDIFEVKDLKEGMICPGIVTNVTNFGAFVDIGVHQDGLVHISELSTKFVDDPRKVANPGDQVTIRVLGVDMEKTQISLSMILEADSPRERAPREQRVPRAEAGRGGGRGAKREAPAAPAPTPTPGPRVGGPQPRAAGDQTRDGARDSGSRPTPRGPGPIQPAGSGGGDSGGSGLGRERGGRVAHIGSNTSGPRQQGGGPRGGQPFNNPFAALLNNDSKSNQKR